MKFTPLELEGAFVLDLERREDDRGFFARSFCVRELETHGISVNIVQSNLAFTRHKGTLRGMHYQVAPSHETKLVRCTRGKVHDVIVDLRPESPTYLKHIGVELTAENRRALYVPAMFAHGYLSLADESEMSYLVGDFYDAACERGLRFDDPALNIIWPISIVAISDKDRSWPLLQADAAAAIKNYDHH